MRTETRGPPLDLKEKILHRVDTPGVGKVWTPVDFLHLGPRAAVDKALQRLVARDELRRLSRGLYDKPRKDPLLAPSRKTSKTGRPCWT